MSEIQELDIFISPEGEVKIEVRGVKGKSCRSLTEGLENALGGQVTHRQHTDEYDQNIQEQGESDTLNQY